MNKTKEILEKYPDQGRDKLIPILQDIQETNG
jgi:NADH:ubiquinone oxidoreductase subunit E